MFFQKEQKNRKLIVSTHIKNQTRKLHVEKTAPLEEQEPEEDPPLSSCMYRITFDVPCRLDLVAYELINVSLLPPLFSFIAMMISASEIVP